MSLDESIPADGDGYSFGTKISQICTAIRALRIELNAGGLTNIGDADGDTGFWTEETADKDEIQGKVANVEFFRGHDNGIVGLPKQSACRAYRSGDQSIPASALTKVELNGEFYDNQDELDIITNFRCTVKESGKYLVIATAYFDVGTDQKYVQTRIYANSLYLTYQTFSTSGTLLINAAVSDVVDLDANDYIEMWVWHNGPVAKNIKGVYPQTYMTVHKLS